MAKDGSLLQTGLYELPVMLEPPSSDIRRLPTDQAQSGAKWVDNKKPIFSVELLPATTVHALDAYIDRFLHLTAKLQLGPESSVAQSSFYLEKDMEGSLLRRINELHLARLEPLAKFLPLILDKLLLLMVKPPAFDGHILDVGSAAFLAIAMIVNKLTSSVSSLKVLLLGGSVHSMLKIVFQVELLARNDRHGRNELLIEYIQYRAHLPHPDLLRQDSAHSKHKQGSLDDEVGSIMRNGNEGQFTKSCVGKCKPGIAPSAKVWAISPAFCSPSFWALLALSAAWLFCHMSNRQGNSIKIGFI